MEVSGVPGGGGGSGGAGELAESQENAKARRLGPLSSDKGTEAGERRGLPAAPGPAVSSWFWTRRQVYF